MASSSKIETIRNKKEIRLSIRTRSPKDRRFLLQQLREEIHYLETWVLPNLPYSSPSSESRRSKIQTMS